MPNIIINYINFVNVIQSFSYIVINVIKTIIINIKVMHEHGFL